MSDQSTDDTARLKQAVRLIQKDDEMECHWSPYCSREGVGFVTAHIGDKPFEVWSCKHCNRSVETETDQDGDSDE